jgi:RND family efflux transporter MFP subunit
MKKKIFIPAGIITIALVISVGISQLRDEPLKKDLVEPSLLVETAVLNPVDTHISISSQGNIEARTQSNLVAEVSGRIVATSSAYVSGGFFRKNDVLLSIDPSTYEAAVSRARANVATAQAALELELGQADVARRQWERMTENEQARITGKELYLRLPQVAEARARLVAAEADLSEAQRNLDKTELKAPYDGILRSKNSDLGQFVNAGVVLGEILATDYAEVRLPIPETRLPFLNLPEGYAIEDNFLPVNLTAKLGEKTYNWQGKLVRSEGVLDPRTRVLYTVVQVADPYGLMEKHHEQPLRMGTFVNANILGQELKNVFVIPRHTLQAGNLVWVADAENRLRGRTIDVVTVNGNEVYVSKGFEKGDRLILTRLETPLNGLAVQTSLLTSSVN